MSYNIVYVTILGIPYGTSVNNVRNLKEWDGRSTKSHLILVFLVGPKVISNHNKWFIAGISRNWVSG